MLKVKDHELKAILAEVSSEIDDILGTEKTRLAKAVGDEPPGEEMVSPPGEASAEEAKEAPAVESPAPEETAPTEEMPPTDAAQAAPHEETPGEIEPTMDPEALKGEYAQLAPEELKMHYLACKAALMDAMGGGAPAPEASAPAPAPMAPAPMVAQKMELDAVAPKGKATAGADRLAAVAPTKKSEVDYQEVNQKVDLLTKALTMVLEQPVRKAVTGMAYIAKSEVEVPKKEFTKEQVMVRLNEVTRRPDLAKSDRALINDYCAKRVGLDKIEHLLTDK